MMRKTVLTLFAAVSVALPMRAADLEPYSADAEVALQTLRERMMASMAGAMAEGPSEAIAVCRHLAPEIARDLEGETGWRIRRVSLRPRNPNNAPDARERSILEGYHMRAAAGQRPQALHTTAIVDGEDGPRVHVMRAIPVLEPCLTCHGSAIEKTVAEQIAALYPEDQATGYEVGDIRGAFSMSRPLDPDFGAAQRPWDRIAALELPDSLQLADGRVGSPARGRTVYADHCRACHGAEALANRYFDGDGSGTTGICRALEKHAGTTPAQDCDIAAFLDAVARAGTSGR